MALKMMEIEWNVPLDSSCSVAGTLYVLYVY